MRASTAIVGRPAPRDRGRFDRGSWARRSKLQRQPGHGQAAAQPGERGPGDRDGQGGRRPDPAAARPLRRPRAPGATCSDLGERLAAESERPNLPWTFRVVDDDVVNAFALPGGFIYVTRGILAHMSDEAELAGVLGHEIGHVTARHSVNQMSKGMLAQIGLGVGSVLSPELANLVGSGAARPLAPLPQVRPRRRAAGRRARLPLRRARATTTRAP